MNNFVLCRFYFEKCIPLQQARIQTKLPRKTQTNITEYKISEGIIWELAPYGGRT